MIDFLFQKDGFEMREVSLPIHERNSFPFELITIVKCVLVMLSSHSQVCCVLWIHPASIHAVSMVLKSTFDKEVVMTWFL